MSAYKTNNKTVQKKVQEVNRQNRSLLFFFFVYKVMFRNFPSNKDIKTKFTL